MQLNAFHETTATDIDTIVELYDRDGFVLLDAMLSVEDTAAAAAAVYWAFEQTAEQYKFIRQRTYEWFEQQPMFVELILNPFVIAFAERLLGDDFHLIAAQCSRNTKQEHYAAGTMKIHQDHVFFPTAERVEPNVLPHHQGFSAMFFMQDTPLAMGPTEVIPKSHVSGETYDNATLSGDQVFVAEASAGSLLLFSHRTWHRGSLNLMDQPRDLITNAYARRATEKVQLLSDVGDGEKRYVEPSALLERGDSLIQQLLKA